MESNIYKYNLYDSIRNFINEKFKEQEFTAVEIAQKFNINLVSARYYLDRLVKEKYIYKKQLSKRNAIRCMITYVTNVDDVDDMMGPQERILQILSNGGTIDEYWRNDTSEADTSIHQVCYRLWKKGYPVLRKKDEITGLITYYFV